MKKKTEITTTDSVWVVEPHSSMRKLLSREDWKFYHAKCRKCFRFYKTKTAAERAMKRNQNYFSGVKLHVYEQFWMVFK